MNTTNVGQKGAFKSMKNFKKGIQKMLSSLLAVAMVMGSVTLPQASTQLESSIPFEYGQGAITNLANATMVGQSYGFKYENKNAYPILATEKTDRYLEFKNAGYYIDSQKKNRAVDMRAYVWAYQEDIDGIPTEVNKTHPFIWIDQNGIANVYSSRMEGTYTGGVGGNYGNTYHEFASASNGGVFMEYHFYDAGTNNEISFKGVMAYNDIDGITDRSDATNEGIAFVSGLDEIIKTTTTTIQEQDRAGYHWYQGSMQTNDLAGDDGLDQDAQKLTIRFTSTPSNPLRIVYRLNTCQSDGRVDGYGYTFTNETVCISYMIPSENLPKLSSNQESKKLIEDGGGEQQRYLNYGTQTNSSSAQAVLNMPAKEVEGYTFDGWYTSDNFTAASKWSGVDSMTDSIVLYGRYVNNEYSLNCRHVYETDGMELGRDQSKTFRYGDEVSTTARAFPTDEPNTSYQVVSYSVNGGNKIPCTEIKKNIHFNSTNRIAGDVNVVYYYELVDGTGTVEVHHVVESTKAPLEGGKYDQTYTGALAEKCHVAPVEIDGWKVTKVKIGNNAEQTISTGITPSYTQPPTVVYFYYEPDVDSAGLTIRYVYDGDPEVELTTPSDKITGSVGELVNANTIRINKEKVDLDSAFTGLEFLGLKLYNPNGTYEIVREGDPRFQSGTSIRLSKEGQSVTFVYKVNGTDIVVRHISKDSCDGGNKVLKTEDKVFKNTGAVFTASPDSFKGYDLIGDSGNTVYTVTDSDNGKTIYIDYYYQHEVHKVTVHHKDPDGNNFVWRNASTGDEISYKDDVRTYHYGQNWTAPIKEHSGYSVVPAEVATGTMGQEDVEVTYVYAPKPATVIVHYVSRDNKNAEIITPKTYTEWVYGDDYTVYAESDKLSEADEMELSKWRLVTPESGRISGKVNRFGDDAINVTFYYTQADAVVTIKHVWVNENGIKEDITTPTIRTGQINVTHWGPEGPWPGADNAGFVLDQRPTIESGIMDMPSLTIEYVYVKKSADLTINYMAKDSDGNLVPFGLASITRRVHYGDLIQLEPKTYPDYAQAQGYRVTEVRQTGANGWKAMKSDGEVTGYGGTVNTDRITVTFVYEPVTVTVTTQYKDTANGNIKGPDAAKAKDWVQYYPAHSKYTTHNEDNLPPTFYGYEWTGRYPANASGTLTDADKIVIYQYALKQTSYIVKYVDESGNRLASDKVCDRKNGYELYVFDAYKEYPISITGYEYKGLAKGSSPSQGNLEELDADGATRTVITFVYNRAASDVVVRYLDTEGNTLAEADTMNGLFGEPFTASPKTITGWTLCSVEATGDVTVNDASTVSGHYSSIRQTVKFIYTRTETSVIVNHIDEETKNSISEPEVIHGKSGDAYEAKPVTLYGYSYVGPAKNSAAISGNMTDGVLIVTLMYRRNTATVTTYFVDNITGDNIMKDKNGTKVENPVVINGRFKDLYDTQPADIYGWKLVKTPENASGAMIDGNIDVVYRYEEYIPKVTARYIDIEDGHEVSETEVITGATGTRYETVAKDYDADPNRYPELYGYRLVRMPDNAAGKFGEEDIVVTYEYEKKTRTITVLFVEYVDGEMVEIANAETLADLIVGDPYDTHAKTIPGYELIGVPDNAKGYVTEKPITVIYVYQKAAATVKVRYVNEAMEDIAPSITIPGHIGDEYTTFAKTIRGYQVATIPANWKGTMHEKETYVTYIYRVATVTVTARYIDADTNEPLRNNITRTYPMNAEYATEALEFHGYTLTEIPSNATGIASNPNGEVVTYYYTQRDAFVTAKYVAVIDGNEKQLSIPVVQTGNVGETYKTSQKDIPGYRLDHVDGETTGKFVEGNIVVTYYYTALESQVIAQYVDTNGATISDEIVIKGNVGDVYDTQQKDIEGYSFVSVTPNASGTMAEQTIYVVYTYKANDSTIITYHVNEKGEQIADADYATCRRNATYQTKAKDIYGYALTDTPANAFGNADKDVITVTYVYRVLPATVEVRYVDTEGNTLAETEVISGFVFDSYKTEEKQFDGYILTAKPANASGAMTVEKITVTYRYEKEQEKADAKVTVKYVDETGKEIAPPETITGKAGDAYSTAAKNIAGFILKETPANASGTMTENAIEVTYVYRKVAEEEKKDAVVTVKYVDEDGKEIASSEEIKGRIGDTYTTKAKEIEKYELKETPKNAEGTIDKETVTVTYVYKKVETAKVTVKFVDEDGKEVSTPITIEGTVGSEYTTTPKDIEGYELVKTPDNAKGKIDKNGNEVTYTYKKKETAKVTVKYVDADGKEIAPPTTIEGKPGDDYEAKAKDIDGYKLKETPENAKGKMTDKEIVVTFTYEVVKPEEGEAVILVKYVDETGKIISQSTTIKGKIGDDYEAKAKEIGGYTLKTTPDNAKGKIAKDITVTFVYTKNVAADAKVIVKYIENVNSKEIATKTTITGKVGDKYDTKAKEISGYKLKTTPSNKSGKMTAKDITVVYIYEKTQTTSTNPSLTIKKTASAKTVTLGSDIKYTVTVKATGGDISNVELQDSFDRILVASSAAVSGEIPFVLDLSNKTIHSASCTHIADIQTGNRLNVTRTYESLIQSGYTAASDCKPQNDVKTSSVWQIPNIPINKDSIKLTSSANRTVKAKEIKFDVNGAMTLIIDEVKKDETVTITYTATPKDAVLVGQTIINNAMIKGQNMKQTSSSVAVTVKDKTTTTTTNTTTNKGNTTTTVKNNGSTTTTNKSNTNWVQTGDTYAIIFVVIAGIILTGGLAFILLRKKK